MFVARDPHGVRALYGGYELSSYINDISVTPKIFFASELKMIYPFNLVNNNIHIEQFHPGTLTTLEVCTNNNLKKWQIVSKAEKYYSRFNYCISPNAWRISCPNETKEEAHDLIFKTFSNCVKRRVTTSDRPIACLLSGGLDSSLVTALVAKYYGAEKLETYNIGMPNSEDAKYARMVANHLGTKHTEIVLTENEFFDAIPDVIKAIESYDTTTVRASVGNYLVAKYISQNSDAKVILNGDGSDEVCGGYMYFHAKHQMSQRV